MTIKRIDTPPTEAELMKALANDTIGRSKDVTHMLDTLGEIEGPYSIFLDSAWGDGKTFLVKQLELVLRLQNERLENGADEETLEEWEKIKERFPYRDLYFPVYFNAWENDDFDDPLLPLLATIASYCQFKNTKTQVDAREAIAGIIEIFAGAGGFALATAGAPSGAEVLGSGVAKITQAFSGRDLLDAFSKRVELRDRFDLLARASLEGVANKLVLFVDELDRCHPRFAVKLLEQAKALFKQDDVILVFSVESTQMAHTIRGLYGERFDAEKYLERFYDMKVDLTPVNSLEYLRHLGYSDRDSYNFTTVANGFIRRLQPTMRDANRLVEDLKCGQRYVNNFRRDDPPTGVVVLLTNGVLLPTLIVMRYERPDLWREIQRGKDFGCIYEYGKSNDSFIEMIDEILKRTKAGGEQYEPNDKVRSDYIEMTCANVFLDDYMDPRQRKASEVLEGRYPGHVNKDRIRALASGSVRLEELDSC